jgi:hypothetical protein
VAAKVLELKVGANPRDFFDNRFLNELEDMGFEKDLYGQC